MNLEKMEQVYFYMLAIMAGQCMMLGLAYLCTTVSMLMVFAAGSVVTYLTGTLHAVWTKDDRDTPVSESND